MVLAIYGTQKCSNCKDLVSYLLSNNIDYNCFTVGDKESEIPYAELNELVGRVVRSVPVILLGEQELQMKDIII